MGSTIRNRVIALTIVGMVAFASEQSLAQDQTKDATPDQDGGDWFACAAATKNVDAGIQACTRILGREVARIRAFALLNRGRALKTKGDLDRAVADFTEAISVDPSLVSAHAERGDVYRDKGQCDQALADYDRALHLLPDRAQIYLRRGLCRIGKGEYDTAMANFDEAIRLDPNNSDRAGAVAWSMKGGLRFTEGDLDRAIADYGEAIRLEPERASFYSDRGVARLRKREYEQAIVDLDQAIKLDPINAASLGNRAEAYKSRGDYDRAIQDYDQAIRLAATASAFKSRGDTYVLKGEYEEAVRNYDEAIRLRQDDLSAYVSRGLARFYLGDFARAADDLVRMAEVANAYPMLMVYLSRARSGGKGAKKDLERNAKRLKSADWPYPLVELLLEKRSVSAAQAAAAKPDERCEAQFYAGQWYLLRQAREEARKAFQGVVEMCPESIVELRAAKEELRRLQPAAPIPR